MKHSSGCIAGLVLFLWPIHSSLAQPAPAAAPAPSLSASARPPAPRPKPPRPPQQLKRPKIFVSCSEYIPKGASRPRIRTTFPKQGTSGYELALKVTVDHGPGETVLPEGFRIRRESPSYKAFEKARFFIPDPKGGSAAVINRPEADDLKDKTNLRSTLKLIFVALPEKPGRHRMTLPPVPIAVGRANGQVMTVCTKPLRIRIEDPIANDPNPKVKGNPPPRKQREDWPLARQLSYAALAVILLAALGAWLLQRWRNRPRIEPAKPKILPWVAAMTTLEEIRRSSLLDDDRFDDYVDRVNDCVRRYLGARYGFDGIESTSEEIRLLLRRVYPPIASPDEIDRFLDDTDLVKYAKVSAKRDECEHYLAKAVAIVSRTTPPRKTKKKKEATS